jgi:RNA polymerase sigma factor (sigma-70 family)
MSSRAGRRYTEVRADPGGTEQMTDIDETVTAAAAGDEPAFTSLAERHRRELHVHCYRMLASFDEAEDAVQETFLNAWRGRSTFQGGEGGGQFRAWLYRIATNICLDMLRRGSRRTAGKTMAEVPWIQPYPDVLLDQAAPGEEQPQPVCFHGPEAIRPLMAEAVAMGEWRVLPVAANRMPAAAGYLRRPGDSQFRAFKLGPFDDAAGHYLDNIVVYAYLLR